MQVDYSVILRRRHPATLWHGSGYTYSSIRWEGTPISQGVLDSERAAVLREVLLERATATLLGGYRAALLGGFTSSALGVLHWYNGSVESQVDLIGSVQLSTLPSSPPVVPFGCSDVSVIPPIDGVRLHTPSQIQQVLLDGALFKQGLFVKLEAQLAALSAMTDVQLQAVQFVQ